MSKSDLILQMAFLGQLLLFFFAFFSLKSEIARLKQRLNELERSINSLTVALNAIKSDVATNSTHISRFDEKGFTNLSNRITETASQFVELDHEVRKLDASLKGFYSTWARKLGILTSKQEKEEEQKAIEDAESLHNFAEAQTPNQIPLPRKSRGWQKLRRG